MHSCNPKSMKGRILMFPSHPFPTATHSLPHRQQLLLIVLEMFYAHVQAHTNVFFFFLTPIVIYTLLCSLLFYT